MKFAKLKFAQRGDYLQNTELEKLAEAVLAQIFVPMEASGRHVHVTEAQLRAINAGELGVVQLNGRYLVVTLETLAEAEAVFAQAVALKVDPNAPAADDPYADPQYQVPDDLIW